MKTINGMSETDYLLGAIQIVRRELESHLLRTDNIKAVETSERLVNLQTCLINLLSGEN